MIKDYLDKNNLHHAYLIEGTRDEIVPEVLAFCENLNIKISGNPDFIQISIDNFKIDEAFSLRSMSTDKSFSSEKKIFMLSVNSFSLDAQNVLLKMFEEPIENTHFFLIVPDTNVLLKTLISRFYLISTKSNLIEEKKDAEKFIAMPLQARINFIKELLIEMEEKDEEGNEMVVMDSIRSKSLKFLNALESVIHSKLLKNSEWRGSHSVLRKGSSQKNSLIIYCEHLFKVREFLRMPGSSTKSLMESVALIVPNLSN